MKPLTFLIGVIGGVCASLLAICTLGQSATKPYIEIAGARLTLGMTAGEVTDRLAGVTITKASEDFWGVGPTDLLRDTMQFTSGKLTFAQRSWPSKSNDIFDSLFGAVTTLNNQGFSSCQVQARTNLQPDASVLVVYVVCGAKSINVTRRTISENSYNEVYEELGVYRKD